MMIDLEEMKQIWANQDHKLDESLRMNTRLLSETVLNKTRTALQRMTVWLGVEGCVWFTIVLWLGRFIYAHIGTKRLAISAIVLDVFAIVMLASILRLIVEARQIDYAGTISKIQTQLENLRVLRIRVTLGALLAGTVVWAPAMIVISRSTLGIDIHSAAWLWTNILFGLALIPLAIWLSKKFSDRLDGSPFLQRMMRDITGRNLSLALTSLSSLAAFKEEETR